MLTRKLKLLALICSFSGAAGVLYQFLADKQVTYESVLVGIPIGLVFAVMELFVLAGRGRRRRGLPFGALILAKAALYTLVVYVTANAVGLAQGLAVGKQLPEFWTSLTEPDQIRMIVMCLATYAVMAFFVQISRMVGQDVLMKFIRGRYRRPTEEDRVFMFLDLKGSTTIAERLGPTYYQLLDDFFHDISHPVMMARAEIYQYVGDEVVLTWDIGRGLQDANCIRVYTLIDDAVAARAEEYRRKYGVVPEYKAGVHCGRVVSAQIGDIKREIVYNGDVVNTTSRIQEQCGELGVDLVVSGDLMQRLDLPDMYAADDLGPTELKGKELPVGLFAVRRELA